MPWYKDGLILAFAAFPALAAFLGLLAGAISNRFWPGAVAGALSTVVLIFTVANETLLVWMPIHALAGFLGGALGCLVWTLTLPEPFSLTLSESA